MRGTSPCAISCSPQSRSLFVVRRVEEFLSYRNDELRVNAGVDGRCIVYLNARRPLSHRDAMHDPDFRTSEAIQKPGPDGPPPGKPLGDPLPDFRTPWYRELTRYHW